MICFIDAIDKRWQVSVCNVASYTRDNQGYPPLCPGLSLAPPDDWPFSVCLSAPCGLKKGPLMTTLLYYTSTLFKRNPTIKSVVEFTECVENALELFKKVLHF